MRLWCGKIGARLTSRSARRAGPNSAPTNSPGWLEASAAPLASNREEVVVRSCEEQGDNAIVHVIFRGKADSQQRSFRDAGTLRRREGEWGVVLPARFGKGR